MDGEPRSANPLTTIAAALATATCLTASHIGADARWLAAVGAFIARAGTLPHTVAYAAVPSTWHDAPALGQLVFHLIDRVGGDRGLVVLQTVAVASALWALALDCRRNDARDEAGAAALVALVVALPAAFLIVRAELFSLALFPWLVLLIRQDARWRTHRIWLAVPLFCVWANLHGGVLVGFAVFAAYLALSRLRRAPWESTALGICAAAALFATPALARTPAYYASVLQGEAPAQHFGLWGRLSLHAPLDVLFVAVAVPMLAAAIRARPPAWELATLAALAAMSVDARRNGLWLLMLAAPRAARALGVRRNPNGVVGPRVAALCLLVVAVPAIASFRQPAAHDGASQAMLERARTAAHGSPILAEPLIAEQLALAGDKVWMANPIEAFPRADQRKYFAWLRGDRGGDSLIREPSVRVVAVAMGSAAQRRLARRHVRVLARDAETVLYDATR
jgi:hypothetical protein